MGNHVKVHRVKVKNWGTNGSGKSCFVLSVLTGDRTAETIELIHAGIEACVAVEPALSGTSGPITVFHVGGKEDEARNDEAFGKAPYIRNCFVDCGSLTNPLDKDIRALSMGWCRAGLLSAASVPTGCEGR